MYKTSCESRYDVFSFEVDKAVALSDVYLKKQPQLLLLTFCFFSLQISGTPVSFSSFSMNLTRGFHRLVWKYVKDVSYFTGEDVVFLKMLELTGVEYADSSCTGCLPGYFSESGATQCQTCPRDSVSNITGSQSCSPCPTDSYAEEGSTKCLPRTECTDNDQYFEYTDCKSDGTNINRQKVWNWNAFTTCKKDTPNPTETVPCGPCKSGEIRNKENCQACAVGSAAVNDQCTPCGDGHAAIPEVYITEWRNYASIPNLSTSCTGTCGDNGWVMRGDKIHSGFGHGSQVDSSLSYKFFLEKAGTLTFTVNVTCAAECLLQIYDNDVYVETITGSKKEATYTLKSGQHTFMWNFDKQTSLGSQNDRAEIYSLRFIFYFSSFSSSFS